LQQINPEESWMDILVEQVLPALQVVLPSATFLAIPAVLISVFFGFLTARWFDMRLNNMRSAAQAWRLGDFSVKAGESELDFEDEITAFGRELDGMAQELNSLLHARQELAAIQERSNLASDLHDSVKQQITAAAFQISAARALFTTNPEAAQSSLVEAENLIHAAHQELNSIIFELRPVALKSGDLARSISDYATAWARQNPLELSLNLQGSEQVPERAQQELIRFVQEALSNIARHSRASRAAIEMSCHGSRLVLSIQDDGEGFDPVTVQSKPGFGLSTMRERVTRLGGSFSVQSQPGHGTRVTAEILVA
jgi:two-component system, NarL family, sensor histidine kinase LiaS